METTRIGVLSAGSAGGVISTGISVAVGAGVPLGGMGVGVGGTGVTVGVSLGGMGVAVCAGVSLGGMGVTVGVSLGAISVALPTSVAVLTAAKSLVASTVSLGGSG